MYTLKMIKTMAINVWVTLAVGHPQKKKKHVFCKTAVFIERAPSVSNSYIKEHR